MTAIMVFWKSYILKKNICIEEVVKVKKYEINANLKKKNLFWVFNI